MVYQFKIQLKGITHPPVWRRVMVPSGFTFEEFHLIIQISFGWENAHLYQFSPQGYGSYPIIANTYGDDQGFDDIDYEADDIKLSEIFHAEKQKYVYIYDFGDDWKHQILLEKILPENLKYPKLIAGKSQCPPEDCGGPWGFMDLKDILKNPKHPEYEDFADWLGLENDETWDPKEFELEYHQNILNSYFAKQ